MPQRTIAVTGGAGFIGSHVADKYIEAGYEVTMVEDGERALAVFRESPRAFDLVLVDAVMPKLSGLDALAAMRALSPNLRFLVMSGYANPSEVGAIEVGAWVSKPFTPERLLEQIRSRLDGVQS